MPGKPTVLCARQRGNSTARLRTLRVTVYD
jgi:hypothetical protein